MTRGLGRSLVGLGALALVAAGAVALGLVLGERRQERRIVVRVAPVAIPTDTTSLERGRYLYASRGCAECHGANGAGRTFVDDPKAGVRIAGANITQGGAGSVTTAYQPLDWVRTIRHGIAPSGRPLRVMPSEDYNRFTDADAGALVAYVLSLPPAAGGAAQVQLPLPARVMYGFGRIPDAADRIDHALPPSMPVAEGITPEHGRYVANLCLGCHGAKLEGGNIPGAPPDWPAAARLAPGDGSAMARYTDADAFVRMLRSGKSPDGKAIAVMPFETLKQMSDTDARALHRYLVALP